MNERQQDDFIRQIDKTLAELAHEITFARGDQKMVWMEKQMELFRLKSDFINGYQVSDPSPNQEKAKDDNPPLVFGDDGHIEIMYATQAEAHAVFGALDGVLSRYGKVTVCDAYELSGIEPSWSQARYGWTTLENVSIECLRPNRVYYLYFPRPESV